MLALAAQRGVKHVLKSNKKKYSHGQQYLQHLDPVYGVPLHARAYDSSPFLGDEKHAVATRPKGARKHDQS